MIRNTQTSIVVTFALLLTATATHAAATPEQACQKGRHDAAGKYAQCQQKEMGKYFAGGDPAKLNPGLSKCRVKYTSTWLKLQKKAEGTGSTCDSQRFVNNGDGTVTDNLTGLDWASANFPLSATDWADANYYSAQNNLGGCNAGECGWRLPTRAELQTILSQPFVCSTSPCIDGTFVPATANYYWTSTLDALDPSLAWVVHFGSGLVGNASRTDTWSARPVRGGL